MRAPGHGKMVQQAARQEKKFKGHRAHLADGGVQQQGAHGAGRHGKAKVLRPQRPRPSQRPLDILQSRIVDFSWLAFRT